MRTESEIASQPDCWRRAVALLPEVAGLLPAAGERVAVVGCGTSWFIAQSYAVAREAAGQGETDAFAASEMPAGRRYDRVVALTRSGTTTEILRLLGLIGAAQPTVAITADPGTPIAAAADALITLDFADEESVVQTRFATTELALLLAHLGTDLEPAAQAAERVLAEPLPAALTAGRQFTFLGTGWTCGLASEAALKLRESAGMWSEAYPAMEFRHGPIAVTGPGSVVWMLGQAPDGPGRAGRRGRRPDVAVRRAPAGRAGQGAPGRGRGRPGGRPGPDRPRNLTRSVILDAAGPADPAR